MVLQAVCCRKCGSEQIVKNGYNAVRNPKYKCKACGFGGVFETKRISAEVKEQLIKSSQERSSARGLGRIYKISHTSVLRLIKKKS
jgi:transposase-like protein